MTEPDERPTDPEAGQGRPRGHDNGSLYAALQAAGDPVLPGPEDLRRLAPPAAFHGDPDRIRGLLLGLAIGDSLGNTSESMMPAGRAARLGEIRNYLPHPHAGGRPMGLPSDDTQMAFWTVEHLLLHGGLHPGQLASRFLRAEIHGIGGTVRSALAALRSGVPWNRSGRPSAGNGAMMRVAPVLLPHLRQPGPPLWVDSILASVITHGDPTSHAACASWTGLLMDALSLEKPPPPGWWVERFISRLRPLEAEVRLRLRVPHSSFEGSLADLLEHEVRPGLPDSGLDVIRAGERWHSGAFLLETVPSVLVTLERHGADPEEAMVRAATDTRDNDTIASLVGSAVGALHGSRSLPARWREGLLGRTGERDDGRVQSLVEEAVSAFCG